MSSSCVPICSVTSNIDSRVGADLYARADRRAYPLGTPFVRGDVRPDLRDYQSRPNREAKHLLVGGWVWRPLRGPAWRHDGEGARVSTRGGQGLHESHSAMRGSRCEIRSGASRPWSTSPSPELDLGPPLRPVWTRPSTWWAGAARVTRCLPSERIVVAPVRAGAARPSFAPRRRCGGALRTGRSRRLLVRAGLCCLVHAAVPLVPLVPLAPLARRARLRLSAGNALRAGPGGWA